MRLDLQQRNAVDTAADSFGGMESDHERSLVAWANTFTETAPAGSLADFATGDALIPIARTIVGDGGNDDDDGAVSGWAGLFSLMQPAGLIDEDAPVPGNDETKERLLGLAVTCLEDLLLHTVDERCLGRETFIRQIMSLDADVQTILRQIIVGEHQQQQSDASSSGVGSPPPRDTEDDVANSSSSSLAESPVTNGSARSPPAEHPASSTGESSYGEDDGSLSDKDDLGLKSWYSPHPRSARRSSRGGRTTGDRAAPVGPKTRQARQGRTLDMEEAEQILVGETAASAAASAAAATDGAAGWTATAVEVRVCGCIPMSGCLRDCSSNMHAPFV